MLLQHIKTRMAKRKEDKLLQTLQKKGIKASGHLPLLWTDGKRDETNKGETTPFPSVWGERIAGRGRHQNNGFKGYRTIEGEYVGPVNYL